MNAGRAPDQYIISPYIPLVKKWRAQIFHKIAILEISLKIELNTSDKNEGCERILK